MLVVHLGRGFGAGIGLGGPSPGGLGPNIRSGCNITHIPIYLY